MKISYTRKEQVVRRCLEVMIGDGGDATLDQICEEYYRATNRSCINHARSSMAALMRSLVLKTAADNDPKIVVKISGVGRGVIGRYSFLKRSFSKGQ
jgi:RNase P/RNase MRP subunit POP5